LIEGLLEGWLDGWLKGLLEGLLCSAIKSIFFQAKPTLKHFKPAELTTF